MEIRRRRVTALYLRKEPYEKLRKAELIITESEHGRKSWDVEVHGHDMMTLPAGTVLSVGLGIGPDFLRGTAVVDNPKTAWREGSRLLDVTFRLAGQDWPDWLDKL